MTPKALRLRIARSSGRTIGISRALGDEEGGEEVSMKRIVLVGYTH